MEKTQLPSEIYTEKPLIPDSDFVADTASLIGNIQIGEYSSIWYGSVLRGDINAIRIGQRSNIQDLSVIHLENDLPCIVGDDVTVGHRAILHACKIEDGALIGMGAIILNGAVVKRGAVIGAGAVVRENEIVPKNSLWVGIPAKQIKKFDHDNYLKNKQWAGKYVQLAQKHQQRS